MPELDLKLELKLDLKPETSKTALLPTAERSPELSKRRARSPNHKSPEPRAKSPEMSSRRTVELKPEQTKATAKPSVEGIGTVLPPPKSPESTAKNADGKMPKGLPVLPDPVNFIRSVSPAPQTFQKTAVAGSGPGSFYKRDSQENLNKMVTPRRKYSLEDTCSAMDLTGKLRSRSRRGSDSAIMTKTDDSETSLEDAKSELSTEAFEEQTTEPIVIPEQKKLDPAAGMNKLPPPTTTEQIADVIKNKNKDAIIELMKIGKIQLGSWGKKLEQSEESIKQFNQLKEEISNLQSMIEVLKNQVADKKGKIKEIEDTRKLTPEQIKNYIIPLAEAERICISEFSNKLVINDWDVGCLHGKDIFIFLNLAQLSKYIKYFAEPNDISSSNDDSGPCISGATLKDLLPRTEYMIDNLNFNISELKKLSFAFYMLENRKLPPYEEHLATCEICSLPVHQLVENYHLKLPLRTLVSLNLQARDILFLNIEDLQNYFDINRRDSYNIFNAIVKLQKFHTYILHSSTGRKKAK